MACLAEKTGRRNESPRAQGTGGLILRDACPNRTVKVDPITQYRLCNPSLVRLEGGGFAATVRGVNYDLRRGYVFRYGSAPSPVPDTQNSFLLMSDDLEEQSHRLIDDRMVRADPRAADGIEDLRLFAWRGDLWVLGSALHYTPKPKNTMLLARFEADTHTLEDVRFIPSPVDAPVEKNWMPEVCGDRLFFVYRTFPLVRYEYFDDGLAFVPPEAPEVEMIADISGSSGLVPYKNGHLAVVHRKHFDNKRRHAVYRHHFVQFEGGVPVKLGRRFSFEGEDVEFCSGLVVDGDRVVLSYGVMDEEAVFMEISAQDMEPLL